MSRKKRDPEREMRLPAYLRNIRNLREDHDRTQQEMADYLHVSQRTYCDYELGVVRLPADSLIRLAEFYGVDMNTLCGYSGGPEDR